MTATVVLCPALVSTLKERWWETGEVSEKSHKMTKGLENLLTVRLKELSLFTLSKKSLRDDRIPGYSYLHWEQKVVNRGSAI